MHDVVYRNALQEVLAAVWLVAFSASGNSVLGIIQIDCYMLESPTLFWDWLKGQLTAL